MIETLALAIVALAIAAGSLYFYPEATAQWYRRIEAFRTIIFGAFAVLVAAVFLGSGSPFLMLWGFVLVIIISLNVFTEFDVLGGAG